MNREEQRELEEEARYYELQHGAKPTAMERLYGAAGTVKGVAQRVAEAGGTAMQKAEEIANSPAHRKLKKWAERVNAQQGISGGGGQPRSAPPINPGFGTGGGGPPINPNLGGNRSRAAQAAGQPVGNPAGSGVFVMQGKILAAPVTQPNLRQPRKSGGHRMFRGGLGNNAEDPGLADDHL